MSPVRLRSRPLLLAVLSVTASVGLLMAGAPQVASASAPAGADKTTIDLSAYGARATKAAASPSAVSPSGCYQQADNPHDSGHFDGRMNGKIWTKCTTRVPRITQTAQLWETRWWGWDRIGVNETESRFNATYDKAYANDWCKNNTVRVTGSGYVVDVDGKTYYASTVSTSVKNPCAL